LHKNTKLTTQHHIKIATPKPIIMLSEPIKLIVTMRNVTMLNVYAKYHNAECHYAKYLCKYHYSEWRYAKCHCAESRYADCCYGKCHYSECLYSECCSAIIIWPAKKCKTPASNQAELKFSTWLWRGLGWNSPKILYKFLMNILKISAVTVSTSE
jgi:hypothetical protein